VSSKNEQKKQVDEIASAVAKTMKATIDAKDDGPVNNGKLDKVNTEGKMLMAELTVARREGAPDPYLITVNEEIRWIKRGKQVIVPWYCVEQMKNNIERKFRKEKDDQGKNVVVFDDLPTESFLYRAIDPAPGVTL
jgi:hypothetical protein